MNNNALDPAETLKHLLDRSGRALTVQDCFEIGDNLKQLRSKLNGTEFHEMLNKLRLTPLMARNYEKISDTPALKCDILERKEFVDSGILASLADLPDSAIKSILSEDPDWLGADPDCAVDLVRDYCAFDLEDMNFDFALLEADDYGWPRISVQSGEQWSVLILRTKMGVQKSCFVRVSMHSFNGYSVVCPRMTDATLGGRFDAPCPVCERLARTFRSRCDRPPCAKSNCYPGG